MSHFVILLAGRMLPTPRLRAALSGARAIAADDGMRHAGPLGLSPELWVGDFDSTPQEPPIALAGVRRETFSRDKDKTDGELAIEAAIGLGADRVTLVGALGGPRSDHAFAHLVLALRYAREGLGVSLLDGVESAYPLDRAPRRFDLLPGTQFSILKFSNVEGLTIEGAKWPLEAVDLPFTSILTQSNEAAGPIIVSLRAGEAILIAQDDPAVR
ncbi:thiamine diphosphokinase [Jiella sonneratiae]|uniref:Thiamine diphosphokinase n=1 Tax=Jiella sonneratiae TaxID=2816856 RepID=A0ABS3J400_9HYPH|nr:thiamine diphosphokinase [Jiella sonneratiae]MBO0904392.1 thiamine diphosphokinase [Jiella sonneratiae]